MALAYIALFEPDVAPGAYKAILFLPLVKVLLTFLGSLAIRAGLR